MVLFVGLQPALGARLHEHTTALDCKVDRLESGTEMIEEYVPALGHRDNEVPDLVVVDLDSPGIVQDLMVIRIVGWAVPVLALADDQDSHRWREAFFLGATDVLPRNAPVEQMTAKIRDLLHASVKAP